MTVRLGKMTFSDWISLPYEDGWTDTFVFRVTAQACLPPFAYAPIIKRLTTLKIRNLRKSMSLWVQVDAPGEWYAIELRRALRGLQVPYAVTDGKAPDEEDFSCPPWLGISDAGRPPDVPDEPNLSPEELLCLQALGRMVKGDAEEIASLAGLPVWNTARMLLDLEQREFTVFRTGHRLTKSRRREIETMPDPVPLWHLTRQGASMALRSWGVPKTVAFEKRYREEQFTNLIPTEHRTKARKWPAWLKAAWPHAEIWTGWSEVKLPKPLKTVPDTLAWGRIQGYETLFWLEVGDDHKRRSEIEDNMRIRLRDALILAKRTNVRLVFAFLGPKWVQDAASLAFERLPREVGVVMAGWTRFGELPVLEWGRVMRR